MAVLEFWLGRAGSGKSEEMAAAVAAAVAERPLGPPVWWVVPGEHTYAAERRLLSRVAATVRAEVLSIERMADRIWRMVHPAARPVTQTGRRLLLATVYHQVAPSLAALQRETPTIPFLDEILAVFAEWAEYGVAADAVEALLESAAARVEGARGRTGVSSRSLVGKLRDICRLYLHYQRALADRDLYDPLAAVALAADVLSQRQVLAGAQIYVDGFADMAPMQMRLLWQAARQAARVVVAVPIDPAWLASVGEAPGDAAEADPPHAALLAAAGLPQTLRGPTASLAEILAQHPHPDEVFAPQVLRWFRAGVALAKEMGLAVKVRTFAPGRRFLAPGLAHLERFAIGAALPPERPAGDGIALAAAVHPRAEAEGVARAIHRLVRRGEAAYRDIGVLVPHVSDYAPYLRECFARYGIPADIDDFPSLATHPLARFVLALVQAAEESLSLSSVLRVLRSDFCGLSRADADWLDAYLKRYEVEGVAAWAAPAPWSFARDEASDPAAAERAAADDARADALRRSIASYLVPFAAALAPSVMPARALAQAVWDALCAVGAKARVAQAVVDESGSHNPLEASLHEQAWQRLLALLDDLALTAGEDPVPRGFLVECLRRGLTEGTLATIPAGLNHVLVTDYRRAGGWEAKYVFVMGATDGRLPRRVHPQGLIHDDERAQFALLFGQPLGPLTEDIQLAERFVVYTVLTRASRGLWITYPLADADGKEVRPAVLLQRIRDLFAPGTVEERMWMGPAQDPVHMGDLDALTPEAARDWLVAALRRGVHEPAAAAAAAAVVAWHLVPRGRREQLRFALRGFRHRTASPGLPPALAEALYGQPLCLAVSRLEAFAACPFRHFAAYGLGLREPDGPDITAAQRGSLLHDALAAFVREQGTDMERWRQLDDDAAAAAMANVVSRLLAEPRYAAWQRRAARRAQVLEAARTLAAAAVVLTRHARYGAFVPRFVEWVFGEEGQPEVAVDLGDGRRVWLRGRIDRIDTVEADGRLAFRIIDYKSSPRGIDFTRLAHGLQIQLPVYAAVVMAQAGSLFGRDAEPASMLYLPVVREVKLTSAPDAPAAARLAAWKAMRASGLLVDDRALVGWHDWRLLQGEATELFKQVYTRQDRLASSADALPAPLWRLVVERAWQHVRSFGRRILDGETAIAPYRIGHEETACRTCPYRAVCQMDPRWDAGLYRRLPSFSKRRLGEWAAEEGTP